MLIDHSREKLINAAIYFSKHTKYCGMTKLMKLLAFLDFIHFKRTGRSVTGLEYYAWPRGPVPKVFYIELKEQTTPDIVANLGLLGDDESPLQKIIPKKKFDSKHFTKREMNLLEELSFMYKETIAKDIVNISHLKNDPWDITVKTKGMNALIDNKIAVDNQSDSLEMEEILRRLEEDFVLKKAFA